MTEQPELSRIAPRTFGIAFRACQPRNLQGGQRTQSRHSAGPARSFQAGGANRGKGTPTAGKPR